MIKLKTQKKIMDWVLMAVAIFVCVMMADRANAQEFYGETEYFIPYNISGFHTVVVSTEVEHAMGTQVIVQLETGAPGVLGSLAYVEQPTPVGFAFFGIQCPPPEAGEKCFNPTVEVDFSLFNSTFTPSQGIAKLTVLQARPSHFLASWPPVR